MLVVHVVTAKVKAVGGREPSALDVSSTIITRVQRKQGSASSSQCATLGVWETRLDQGIELKDETWFQLHGPV